MCISVMLQLLQLIIAWTGSWANRFNSRCIIINFYLTRHFNEKLHLLSTFNATHTQIQLILFYYLLGRQSKTSCLIKLITNFANTLRRVMGSSPTREIHVRTRAKLTGNWTLTGTLNGAELYKQNTNPPPPSTLVFGRRRAGFEWMERARSVE